MALTLDDYLAGLVEPIAKTICLGARNSGEAQEHRTLMGGNTGQC